MVHFLQSLFLGLSTFFIYLTGHHALPVQASLSHISPTSVEKINESPSSPQHGMIPRPPQEAFDVCASKTIGASCTFTAPRGTVVGTCQKETDSSTLRCTPIVSEQNQDHPRVQNY